MEKLQKYSKLTRILHWLNFILLVGLYALIYKADNSSGDGYILFRFYHCLLGYSLIIVIGLQFLAYIRTPIPPYPRYYTKITKKIFQVTQFTLYVFVFLTAISGYISMAASSWFSNCEDKVICWILAPIPQSNFVAVYMGIIHRKASWILLGLIIFHILYILKRTIINKDKLFKRIIF